MSSKVNLSLLLLCCTSIVFAQPAYNSQVFETFDSPPFNNWVADGEAFTGTDNDHDMIGSFGGIVASLNQRNEPAVGTLTSAPFTIEHNSIHFMLGANELFFLEENTDLSIQLLVDGEIVRTKVPKEFHAMFWYGWDVSDLKGQTAAVRIVDNDNRPWAHITVDHIVLTDLPADGLLIEHTLTINEPLINFPVNEKDGRCYLELWVDGQQIRGLDVSLAPDDIDYWVVTDLSAWKGKQVQVRTRQFGEHDPAILNRIAMADEIIDSGDLYNEPLRSQFHFSSKRGWLNDPNGLVYYDGEFHLFYQHNPYGWDHSRNDYNKTWGHAVSTDLIHWEELAGAVHPDRLGNIYSGSSVIDHNNTTGFQTGDDPPMVCVFTSAGGRSPWSLDKKFSQSMSYSTDGGRTFTKYEGNPIIPHIERINRDPKVIWHEPTNRWVLILHFDERAMGFFTSTDMKSWEFHGEFESEVMQDCPELFELPVDGDENNKRWVMHGGNGAYYLGEFNGTMFTPDGDATRYNYGNAFYASQTFSNVPATDGRRIQIAWGTIPTPDMPFNMMMLAPVSLTLHNTDDGIRMFSNPVNEIENIRVKTRKWNDVKIKSGKNILADVDGELFDIEAEFVVGRSKDFGFIVNGLTVNYNRKSQTLSAGKNKAKVAPIDGKLKLRILVDRVSVEIFANDGMIYMPMRAYATPDNQGLELFAKGRTTVSSLQIHELKSIWK